MKKAIILCLGLGASYLSAQQAGDLYSFEQKLNLTPQGVANFLNNLSGDNPPEIINFLNGYHLGLKAYKVTYYTKNEKNNLVKATGLIMYPDVNYKLSTVVSDHGTTDNREHVPSNISGGAIVIEFSYALNGYILMAPDYVGMGDGEGVHPYVHAATEGGATVDFVKAANKVLEQLGIKRYNEYFLTGYSQGAHAAMSTLKALSISNPDNLKFKYAYMGDGPYDLSGVTLQKGILEKDIYPFSSFLANIIHSCNNSGYKTYTNTISEVISAEYLDRYDYHVVQDHGGLFWGPPIWRKLFTQSFVQDATVNSNNKLRQCLRASDVYDWYNKTPTTLGHSTVDLLIPTENTPKTIDTQRSYYPWWDMNKYKLQAFYWGPIGHIGGVAPFVLASNAKFNTLRSGGLFNEWAMLTTKNADNNLPKTNPLLSSQIIPDLQGMNLVEVTDFNKEKTERKILVNNNLSTLKDGVYLLKVNQDNTEKLIPYIKITPQKVTENEIIKSENNNILNLKINQDELLAVNIFDETKNLVKTVSQEEYKKNGGINLNNIDNQNYTFEIVTQFYNLQFNKSIGGIASDNIEAYAQNHQIFVKSRNDIKNVTIYNISGALIQNQEVKTTQFESNNLQSGIYVVQITLSNGKILTTKVQV